MQNRLAVALAVLIVMFLCRVEPSPAVAGSTPKARVETGMASLYSNKLAGRKTACGRPYDPSRLTAAHRTLPMGTVVRVTNLSNGRSVLVRINDRGPFIKGRIIDLSYESAARLRMIRRGVIRARVETVSDRHGRAVSGTGFYVCCGESARRVEADVERVRRELGARLCDTLPPLHLVEERHPAGSGRAHVAVGPFLAFADAETAFEKIRRVRPEVSVRCFPLKGTGAQR